MLLMNMLSQSSPESAVSPPSRRQGASFRRAYVRFMEIPGRPGIDAVQQNQLKNERSNFNPAAFMARNRTIDTDAVLDAAERVAIRDGAVGLSIDAVAKEAGISKSRVVYDYKSKSGLLQALIERRLRTEDDRILAAIEEHRGSANPELCGRIAAASEVPKDDDRAIALTICAAMSSEEPLQDMVRKWVGRDIGAVQAGAGNRALALVAYLALHGLMSLEYMDFHRWDPIERDTILNEIRQLSEAASSQTA
jgi:AcrR family transcriptional regulator